MPSIREVLKQEWSKRRSYNPPERIIQNAKDTFLLAEQAERAFSQFHKKVSSEETDPVAKKIFSCLQELDEVITEAAKATSCSSLGKLVEKITNIGIKTPLEENLVPGQFFLLIDYSHGEHQILASLARVDNVNQHGRFLCSEIDLASIKHQPAASSLEIAAGPEAEIVRQTVLGKNERVVLPVSNIRFQSVKKTETLHLSQPARVAA